MTMRQGQAAMVSLKSEWADRYTYCTRQEARLSIKSIYYESVEPDSKFMEQYT
jgi:hypothetical protein